jgi:Rrf2 family protein
MKLTTKCRYGSRAIVEIARNQAKGPVKRKQIVENQKIPDSYLENILISLKNRGIVSAARGPRGGFILKRPPSSITMLEVVLALEDSLSPVDCLDDPGECDMIGNCVTRPVWRKLGEAQEKVLKSITVQDLIGGGSGKDEPEFII